MKPVFRHATGRSFLNYYHPRNGSLLIETLVAAIILGTAVSMLVPVMTAVRRQRQSHRFETMAMLELNNLADFLPVSFSGKDELRLSDWFLRRYSTAELQAEILPPDSSLPDFELQALRLTIRRSASDSLPPQHVSLVVWQRIQETSP